MSYFLNQRTVQYKLYLLIRVFCIRIITTALIYYKNNKNTLLKIFLKIRTMKINLAKKVYNEVVRKFLVFTIDRNVVDLVRNNFLNFKFLLFTIRIVIRKSYFIIN